MAGLALWNPFLRNLVVLLLLVTVPSVLARSVLLGYQFTLESSNSVSAVWISVSEVTKTQSLMVNSLYQ